MTLVTHKHEPLFGEVMDQSMHLSTFGEIVHQEWLASQEIRREIELDEFVVMPNHLHGIVCIVGAHGGAPHGSAPHDAPSPNGPTPIQRPPRSLGSFIAGFKSACTKRINTLRDLPGAPVWLRNYYERVIRNERELSAIRKYILDNPAHWEKDQEHPDRTFS